MYLAGAPGSLTCLSNYPPSGQSPQRVANSGDDDDITSNHGSSVHLRVLNQTLTYIIPDGKPGKNADSRMPGTS